MLLMKDVTCRLNNPTATLYGFASNSTGHAVIMTLSSPKADSANRVRPLASSCGDLLCSACEGPAHDSAV